MRQISVSTNVFSKIWSKRIPGEDSEDEILSRLLADLKSGGSSSGEKNAPIETAFVRNRKRKKPQWVDDIVQALVQLGGRAKLEDIYHEVQKIRQIAGRSLTKQWKATVRRTLEDHSSDSKNFRAEDIFYMPEGKHRGIWALRID